ncbi:hypothetical protein E2986_00537 [Frieseomelitta varia]|uniref:Uncharacterized protein n=1 Tax=Frieseomelitta varia TaxID=561572 RepID=A0A833SA62_9HYME|nr:hypothetical protein E2986_00537 [Frieseomelitta varia]
MKNTVLTVLFYSCLKLFAEVRSNTSFLTDDAKNSTLKSRIVLPEHYVKEIRPPLKQGLPVIVDFNIFVADINSINVEDMDFRVDMFVRQSWIESRLDMPDNIFEEGDDYVTLPPEFFDNLWQPDPYFLNAKVSGENCGVKSQILLCYVVQKQNGQIFGTDACHYRLSNGISTIPNGHSNMPHLHRELWGAGAVTVNPELKLLQYDIGKPMVAEETVDYMVEKSGMDLRRFGNFSRLVVFFRFERQIGHHLIQTFAPSTLVVMLSWFSFWLGLDAIPGRVALLVTSMLTLVTMFTGLKSDIPPVAYVKALDVWMAGCMMFVFAALGEFVVVKVLDLRYQLEYDFQSSMFRHHSTRIIAMEKGQSIWDYDSTYVPKARNKRAGSKHLLQNAWLDPEYPIIRVYKTRSQKIDTYSRIGFPILFMLFIVLYWPILLLKKAT